MLYGSATTATRTKNPMNQIKVKDIYALPSTAVDLEQWSLKTRWLPELSSLIGDFDCPVPVGLADDNRFVIKSLIEEDYGGCDYSRMCTIWFDEKPVLIFQEAEVRGQDHFKRWITDQETYAEMLVYLVAVLTEHIEIFEDQDVTDPETEVPLAELLKLFRKNHLEKFTTFSGVSKSERHSEKEAAI